MHPSCLKFLICVCMKYEVSCEAFMISNSPTSDTRICDRIEASYQRFNADIEASYQRFNADALQLVDEAAQQDGADDAAQQDERDDFSPQELINSCISPQELINSCISLVEGDDLNGVCSISHEQLSTCDSVAKINACGHMFKESSIRAWLERDMRCPLCRQ